jgi:hypothetical protein
MNSRTTATIDIVSRTSGRALYLSSDGGYYLSRGLSVYKLNETNNSWLFVARLPCALHRRIAGAIRLAGRLLRHEVRSFITLSGGSMVAANRQGVYFGRDNQTLLSSSSVDAGTQALAPPMMLCIGPSDRVLFGEYNSKTAHGMPVRLFVSDDLGRTFHVARTFEGGSILHVHNLVHDAKHGCYWLLAGDHHHEPGIGRVSLDLKSFDWLVKGQQRYRAVEVFDLGDRLVYATDTHLEQNALISLDKSSGKCERLREFDGSCIYACRFGKYYALSTTIEPSPVNSSRIATLWLSTNAIDWQEAFTAEKDAWHPVYFQFGSIILPRGGSRSETVLFSGQALKGIDGDALLAQAHQ